MALTADTQINDNAVLKQRARRYVSHALVEVRRIKWLPLFCQSAVLLDISTSGFKLEFTGEVRATPGLQYWIHIPLSPLGIPAPSRLICHCEVRWFDDHRYRIGGTFLNLSKTDMMLIEQIVSSLKTRGQL